MTKNYQSYTIPQNLLIKVFIVRVGKVQNCSTEIVTNVIKKLKSVDKRKRNNPFQSNL